MTRFIFEEILSKINNNTSEHIVLLLDNFSGHKVLSPEKYKNTTLIFLPPNSTSLYQPLDQGIIKSFKTFNRSLIIHNYYHQYTQDKQYNLVDLRMHLFILGVLLI